jgi:hypothetical protein
MAKTPQEPRTSTPTLKSPFSRADLEYKLKYTLVQLGKMYIDAGGELSEYIFKQYLPLQVLETAFATGMLEPPNGAWTVADIDKQEHNDVVAWFDEFLKFLPVDECYEEWATADIWERPTPPQILKRFRIASKLTNERIAEGAGVSLKTLERLITRDRLGMRMSNAKKLLDYIQSWIQLHAKTNALHVEEVSYFMRLKEVELFWRSKE